MAVFTYQALDNVGQSCQGTVDADSARAARALLRTQGLIPLEVQHHHGTGTGSSQGWNITLWPQRVMSTATLAVWTRQLAGLVGAGLPLERALGALDDEYSPPPLRQLTAWLRAEVNAGASLAMALRQHPREFDDSYVAVIAAGEHSGALDQVLQRLAHDLEERDVLRQKLWSAGLYPAIVTAFSLLIVLFMMTYVVPQVAAAFSSGNRALPTLTLVMLALSGAIRQWGLWLIPLVMGALVGLIWMRRQPVFRLRLDAAWLRAPILGRLSLGYNSARFAAVLALLAGAGVPILKALQTSAQVLHNHALRDDAQDALLMIREGAPIAAALASRQRFPPLLITFIRLGEQTGQLPQMLERASEQLGAEVQRRALRLATLLEPLLILTMGVVVLLIVLSVMLPIIQLNQLIR